MTIKKMTIKGIRCHGNSNVGGGTSSEGGWLGTRETIKEKIRGEFSCKLVWGGGESARSPSCSGSIPGLNVTNGLFLLVLHSARRGFYPGTPVFPSPHNHLI